MKKVVKNKPLTDSIFHEAVRICLENDPVNGLFNVEPYGKMPDWDVSQVTDMSFAFWGAKSFNANISKWNVSNVGDMNFMFFGALDFNQNISNWNVSKVALFDSFNENTPAWTLPKPKFKTSK